MSYEVVVVGGGIGGLTVAALLAARGVSVCLLERESIVGGCAASFDKLGYRFEQGSGLYSSWHSHELHQRVFSQLPVQPPEVRPLEPSYVVRLPDQSQVRITVDTEEFEAGLRTVFPECPQQAVLFFRDLRRVGETLSSTLRRVPDLSTAGRLKRIYASLPEPLAAARIRRLSRQTVAQHLTGTSSRFRRFVDVQLQEMAQAVSEGCSYLQASIVLGATREGMFSIRGGAASLAEALAQSFKESGGTLRLNTAALRVAYNAAGYAGGVTLLNGETINASRAIVSNLTVWDTYGRLVGLDRTPSDVRKALKKMNGWGAYLLFLGIDETTAESLPATHILALRDWQRDQSYQAQESQFMFAVAPEWDPRAPAGKRAVTMHTFTEVEEWFRFHEEGTEDEEQDQSLLESWWQHLHEALPELGSGIEVIDTATPRTFYDLTRRRLGMVGGVKPVLDGPDSNDRSLGFPTHLTSLPNLFMVGDTTLPASGLAAVTRSALIVANHLTA